MEEAYYGEKSTRGKWRMRGSMKMRFAGRFPNACTGDIPSERLSMPSSKMGLF
jgi:hypothetical protein